MLRRMPFFKVLAIGQALLLARRHLRLLSPRDRRRLSQLVRRGPRMNRRERAELRRLIGKLEPRMLAAGTADAFSPVPLPRWLGGKRARA
jgi:hypothetical protein